jgi:excinuclease ABC subunit C
MNNRTDAQHTLDPKRLKKILPKDPGVYLFKDKSARVIYVGKAKNLNKRILSYFKTASDTSGKTARMMKKARGLDFIITSTEKEAFILERNLIKENMPRYNIVLRDDKQYPCLRLDIKNPYPRITIARKIKKDGGLYFGPFSSAQAVRNTLKVIDRVFQLRKCKSSALPKRSRPCLNYEMDRCIGPCTQDIPISLYHNIVKQVRLFLEGRNRELIHQLRRDMDKASNRMDYERAARIRDQINDIEKTVERQRMVSTRMEDQDIIGLAHNKGIFQVVILFVRKGYVVGTRDFLFKDTIDPSSDVMASFLKQYYARETFIPSEILISEHIKDITPMMEWLSEMAGKKIVIHRPIRGEKVRLVNMANANAKRLLESRVKTQYQDLAHMIQSALNLKSLPNTIEGLDISNLKGNQAVGAIVSFLGGLPNPSGYRNYRIKTVNGIDDYGMMTELMRRRLSMGGLPDLFLVDGGKGHLAAVQRVLDIHPDKDVPEVISIAKPDETRNEKLDKIFVSGRKNPLALRPDHPVLLFFMRIRDEAHRRAVLYHRKLRKRELMGSDLDTVPGIGGMRKSALFNYFKNIDEIASASVEDLSRVPGISPALAKRIFSHFNGGV